jgi:hypothetical protein
VSSTHTDPATGRPFIVDPVTGESRWADSPPAPAQPPVDAPPVPNRRHRGRWVALGVSVAVLAGGVVWAFPTAGGCEDQVNAEVIQALKAPALKDFKPDTDKSHYWRCYRQSDEAMTEIGQKVLARHWVELLGKGLKDAFATTP